MVGFDGDPSNANSIGGSLLHHLGLTSGHAVRIIGILPEADYDAAVQNWRVPRRAADGTALDPATRLPTVAESGQARLFGRACGITSGNGQSLAELQARLAALQSTPATTPASPGNRKLKMNSIASQVDDTEFEMSSEADLMNCFRCC